MRNVRIDFAVVFEPFVQNLVFIQRNKWSKSPDQQLFIYVVLFLNFIAFFFHIRK